jgi:hypothetical protein
MAWFLAIVSLVSALLPIADRGMQVAQQRAQQPVAVTAYKPVTPDAAPMPPDAGQPGVLFHQGNWWKWTGREWLLWQPTSVAPVRS